MMNQQLVEYIKQQMQAGVAKDAVRKALTDAGWPAADIDDSLKVAAPATAAVTTPAGSAMPGTSTATINPAVAMGGTDPMSVKPAMGAASGGANSDKFFAKSASMQSTKPAMTDDGSGHASGKKFVTMMIVMGAVILLLGGALAFVYFNLSGQLTTAQQSGGGSSAALATLQNNVTQLTKDKTDLTTQLQSLTVENQSLTGELGFFVAPAGTTSTVANVQGLLSGNASSTFVLVTVHKIKITIANSKDAKVAAALTPLANTTSTVMLSGTHAPASTNLTVTSVNGAAL